MPVVYLIQDPGPNRDLSSAQRYGAIQPLLTQDDKPGLAPSPSLLRLRKGLENLLESDYVCWAGGDPAAAILAGIALAQTGIQRIQFLRWERERDVDGRRKTGMGFYVPTIVNLVQQKG